MVLIVCYYNNFVIEDDYLDFILKQYKKEVLIQQQWRQCLQKIPNGVILYDLKEGEVVFENTMVDSIMTKDCDLPRGFDKYDS